MAVFSTPLLFKVLDKMDKHYERVEVDSVMTFKAAIFDVGGVLLQSPVVYMRDYAVSHGLPEMFVLDVLKKGLSDNVFERAEKGAASLSQVLEEVDNDFKQSAKENNLELPSAFSSVEIFRSMQHAAPHKEIVNAVANLKNHGFKTGILTNNIVYDLPSVGEDRDNLTFLVKMRFMFDEIIESCQTGLQKPDKQIYNLACQKLGVTPQETIFVDDLKSNLEPAEQLGMATVLFTDVPSTLTKIQELTGVDVSQKAEPVAVDPDKVSHNFVTTKDGVRLHYVEMGEGPAVILCHGFPESWYSWRKQIPALVLAGYRVIVPDQRGYGETSAPPNVEDYTMEHICSDLIEIMDSLSIPRATIVGHDWGGFVVWRAALRYPTRIRGVVGVNTPYFPPGPDALQLETLKQNPRVLDYILYFQTPGVAEAELEKNVEKVFKFLFRGTSKQDYFPGREKCTPANVRERGGFVAGVPDDIPLPSLITEKDLAYYVKQYKTSGFRGPVNWYRNLDQNWKDSLKDVGRKIYTPALMVTAENDVVLPPASSKAMEQWVPNLSRVDIKNCSHWTQMERPGELNEGLIKWLNDVHEKANIPVKPRY